MLDDAARAKHGINLGAAVTGPMTFHVKAPLSQKGAPTSKSIFPRRISTIPYQVSVKPAGNRARRRSAPNRTPRERPSNNIAIDAGGASHQGTAQLSSDGSFVAAKLSQVRFFARR